MIQGKPSRRRTLALVVVAAVVLWRSAADVLSKFDSKIGRLSGASAMATARAEAASGPAAAGEGAELSVRSPIAIRGVKLFQFAEDLRQHRYELASGVGIKFAASWCSEPSGDGGTAPGEREFGGRLPSRRSGFYSYDEVDAAFYVARSA